MTLSINGNYSSVSRTNQPDPAEMKAKIKLMLKSAGATDEEISNISGPDDVKELASKYGVSLPAPPQPPQNGLQASSIFQQDDSSSSVNSISSVASSQPSGGTPPGGPPPEVISALQSAGATSAEIASISGPQDAQALAAKYNISLPAPPQPPPQSGLQSKSIFLS